MSNDQLVTFTIERKATLDLDSRVPAMSLVSGALMMLLLLLLIVWTALLLIVCFGLFVVVLVFGLVFRVVLYRHHLQAADRSIPLQTAIQQFQFLSEVVL